MKKFDVDIIFLLLGKIWTIKDRFFHCWRNDCTIPFSFHPNVQCSSLMASKGESKILIELDINRNDT